MTSSPYDAYQTIKKIKKCPSCQGNLEEFSRSSFDWAITFKCPKCQEVVKPVRSPIFLIIFMVIGLMIGIGMGYLFLVGRDILPSDVGVFLNMGVLFISISGFATARYAFTQLVYGNSTKREDMREKHTQWKDAKNVDQPINLDMLYCWGFNRIMLKFSNKTDIIHNMGEGLEEDWIDSSKKLGRKLSYPDVGITFFTQEGYKTCPPYYLKNDPITRIEVNEKWKGKVEGDIGVGDSARKIQALIDKWREKPRPIVNMMTYQVEHISLQWRLVNTKGTGIKITIEFYLEKPIEVPKIDGADALKILESAESMLSPLPDTRIKKNRLMLVGLSL